MIRSILIFTAAALMAAPFLITPVYAQEEPETTTGSRLQAEPEPPKTKTESYDADKSRRIAKKFGDCLFDRRKNQSIKLLTVSDYRAIDYANLGEAEYLLGNRILMEQCLGRVGRPGMSGIGMSISNMAIRASLTEAAYLDAYRDEGDPIKLPEDAPEFLPNRFFVSGDTYDDAVSVAYFADCVVYNAPAKAHAILQTKPASDEELTAVKAIVPALGGCLSAGNEMSLDVESIRAFVADGLWARSYYGTKLEGAE